MQWERKMNNNSNNINNKNHKKRKDSHRKTVKIGNTKQLPSSCFLGQVEPLLPGSYSLSPAPGKEVRWYRNLETSYKNSLEKHPTHAPLLDTAKINPLWLEPGQSQGQEKQDLMCTWLL